MTRMWVHDVDVKVKHALKNRMQMRSWTKNSAYKHQFATTIVVEEVVHTHEHSSNASRNENLETYIERQVY